MLIEMSRKKFYQFERNSSQIRFATMWLKLIILLMVIPLVLGNFATKTITGNGYSVEIHTITTKDGYILNTYRIPCGRKCVKPNDKPVLLVHGMCGSCEQFMMLGNNSLAFLLADQGYDVWMMNVRGTDHSRKHKYLSGKQYWDFSWHEIALYDLEENIDYILNYTKSNELFYVCHSMGCTVLLVLASEKPEYNTKIKLAQLMAPGVFVYHFNNGMLRGLAQLSDFFLDLSNFLRLYELPLPNWAARDLFKTYCFRNDDFYKACQLFVSAGGGDVLHYPNKVNLEDLFSFFPQPMSIRQLLHYGQVMRDGKFQKYNYGSKKNLRMYGEKSPPPYNLSRVVLPIVLYASKGDSMVTVKNGELLENIIPFTEEPMELDLDLDLDNLLIMSGEADFQLSPPSEAAEGTNKGALEDIPEAAPVQVEQAPDEEAALVPAAADVEPEEIPNDGMDGALGEGVRALSTELPNVVAFNEVELEKFNHNDYVLAPEAKNFVFDKILSYLLQFMK